MDLFIADPRVAEVYNIGGGKDNSCSILEAFSLAEQASNKRMVYEYIDTNRIGDHICYYSDLSKMKEHYPKFGITKDLSYIIENIYKSSNGK
jgi:CDP-paratose 2-epimerase